MRLFMIMALAASLSLSATSCATWKQNRETAKTGVMTLEGSSWTLAAIPGVELEATPKPVTLNFGKDQRVGGHAGCNGFGGTYTQEGNKLSLSQLISTKMACMPGLKTENAYMSALQKANSFVIKAGQLELQEDGTTLIILDRADNEASADNKE